MATSSHSLPWVGSPSTALEHLRISPARYRPLHSHRLLPDTLASSLSTLPALPSSSSFFLCSLRSSSSCSSFLGSPRVNNLLEDRFPDRKCPRSQLWSSLPTYPRLPPLRQLQLQSSKQISGKVMAVSASSVSRSSTSTESEEVFFDGGVHFGDLVVNLVFGLTLAWLPLTLTAVFRNLFLRYRFTNLRVTVQSGLLGGDRKDFSYDVVKDVKVVPRFVGEWGDMAIELKDGTIVDIRCVPKFREIADYIEQRAAGTKNAGTTSPSPAREAASKKGFS